MIAVPPLGLYVHLPWCERKCPYCDFNSYQRPGSLPESAYVDALLADLDREAQDAAGRTVETVFLGGGTPSLLSAEAIARLLAGIASRVDLAPDAEITLEANPGSFEQARFADYRAGGVNRLSLGVQSFDDDLLARIGRVHDGRQARRAAEQARAAGFDNLNLDLMLALPGQTPAMALDDLETALSLAPAHLSHYQLTLEEGTAFGRRPPPGLAVDGQAWRMQRECRSRLAAAGFVRYEVSAYAAGPRCRHNLNYWRFGDYLGIGAGAHGKLTDPRSGRVSRRWKLARPERYVATAGTAASVAGERRLGPADLRFEFMLNALRLVEGVDADLLPARTGQGLAAMAPALGRARALGLLATDPARLRPTALGRRFLDDLVALFLEPEATAETAVGP